jgi:hypothetical protein
MGTVTVAPLFDFQDNRSENRLVTFVQVPIFESGSMPPLTFTMLGDAVSTAAIWLKCYKHHTLERFDRNFGARAGVRARMRLTDLVWGGHYGTQRSRTPT